MALDQIRDMMRGVAETAKVETVFGESREIAGRTIIPVARVMYGGGGGGGQGKAQEGQEGTGGGGGMGVNVQPLGVFVITENAERFVATVDLTRVVLAGTAVALAAILTTRKVLLHKQQAKWMGRRWTGRRHRHEEREREAA